MNTRILRALLAVSGSFAACSAGASTYRWTQVLQSPVDESYFGPNDPRNHYDPMSNAHPMWGSIARRNGGYAWGVTTHGDEIWYGAFMNGWCLWLQFAGVPPQTADNTHLYNYVSEKNACDIREPNRPLVIQVFNTKTGTLEVYQSTDARFARDMKGIIAIRAAGTVGGTVFITALLGRESFVAAGDLKGDDSYFFSGVRVLAVDAVTRKYLGSVTMSDLNEARKMNVIGHADGSEGLYLGASSRSGKSYLLRWTGSAANPFPARSGNEYPGFEVVIDNTGHGLIGELTAISDASGRQRLVASTWSSWPSVNKAGGLYMSTPMPAGGFRKASGTRTLQAIMTLDQYDPDAVIGPTWGGGSLSAFGKYVYWGTMTIGTASAGAYAAVNRTVGTTPASRDGIARASFARAAHLFRADISDPDKPRIELLFGNEYYPVLDAQSGEWTYKRNLLGLKPLLGKAGFGYGTNNYTWESKVFEGRLFVGTMDYSGGLVDYVEHSKDGGDYQIHANYRIAKEQGFIPGGDMLVFENHVDQPIVITRSGLGNEDNNGFRNFVVANGTLYAGTSSEANIGPTAGYSFHRLEIRER